MELVSFLFLGFVTIVTSQYINQADQPMLFQCPNGQSISQIRSRHFNAAEDRVFGYSCQNTPGFGNCRWHGYANTWDQDVFFQCDNNGIISGINSYHDNGPEDRRFRYYCCYPTDGKWLTNCDFSSWANDWDTPVNFRVSPGRVLKGVFSVHDNGPEDRRFKYETCHVR